MATELEKLKDVVLKFEETKQNAYIPFKDGKVAGNSGVTIGKGLDLGQQDINSINDLKTYGLSEELAKKLRDHPDLGKKFTGQKKADVTFSALTISPEEEAELNKAIIDKYKTDFYDAYETHVGRKITDDLTENQRIALTSAAFNLGTEGLFKVNGVDTNFKTQLKNKQFSEAAKNLGTWSKDSRNASNVVTKADSLQYRRAAEAALFGNYIDYNDVNNLKTSFLNDRISEVNTEGQTVKTPSAGFKEFQNNLKVLSDGAVPSTAQAVSPAPVQPTQSTPEPVGVDINQPIGLPDLTNKEDIKRVQQAIGVKVDGYWGPKSEEAWTNLNNMFVTDTYRQEGMPTQQPVNINTEPTWLENPFLSVKNWWDSL